MHRSRKKNPQDNTPTSAMLKFPIRLNRYLAHAGICSRRQADQFILDGKVTVNKKMINKLGQVVQQDDVVTFEGKRVYAEQPVYILFNKPKDCITTMHDPQGRKTVMHFLASCKERVYPVGRLDRNTTGLLLFTNDGALADQLSHPSNKVKKIYHVGLNKPITKQDFNQIASGITLEDGLIKVDEVALIDETQKNLGVEIHSGKNRIVRRIFEHLGYDVVKLDRVVYAGLTKKNLPRKKWRYLPKQEVIKLKYFKS